MNGFVLTFLAANAVLLLVLPRRWALLPVLIGTCYMTRGPRINIGSFTFTILRILIIVGFVRVIMKRERFLGGINGLDKLMLAWAVWIVTSSAFHKNPSTALVFRLGFAYDVCGVYFLIRTFCQSMNDILYLCRILVIALVPIALEMLHEKLTGYNLFSLLGGVGSHPVVRKGRIRAQGPFAHSILAGTVGAVCLPLIVAQWKQDRKEAILGIVACLVIIFSSASSGPILSTLAAIGAELMWHFRHRMKLFRWLALLGYIGLDLIMTDPPYYLMARIDLVGGSTGWHRARLIQSAFEHLKEWWLAGTDYTRLWMPTGVSWSPNNTDITNYYLHMGVIGGLPLMLLFIGILAMGFSFVGKILKHNSDLSRQSQFMIWSLGASLFTHAVTCVSVSYFDQSFFFLYTTLAAIASLCAHLTEFSRTCPGSA